VQNNVLPEVRGGKKNRKKKRENKKRKGKEKPNAAVFNSYRLLYEK
jgi:hypothetical protein